MTSNRKGPSRTVTKLQSTRECTPSTPTKPASVRAPIIRRLLPLPTKELDCVYALHKFDRLSNRGDLVESPPKIKKLSDANESDEKHCTTREAELRRCRTAIVLLPREADLPKQLPVSPSVSSPPDQGCAVTASPQASLSGEEDRLSTASCSGGTYCAAAEGSPAAACGRDSVVSLSSSVGESVGVGDGLPPSSSEGGSEPSACRWQGCHLAVTESALLQHVQQAHMRGGWQQSFKGSAATSCQWQGCKVFGQKSRSCAWLEGHVLKHVPGAKPFCCIVAGCDKRFGSQLLLERHVTGHFADTAPPATGSCSKLQQNRRPTEESATKQKKQQRKLLKGRQLCTRKTEDFIDPSTLDGIQKQLFVVKDFWEKLLTPEKDAVTFTGEVAGQRTDPSGCKHLLIRWHPLDILDDCWVPEKELERHRTRVLSVAQLQHILGQLPAFSRISHSRRKPAASSSCVFPH